MPECRDVEVELWFFRVRAQRSRCVEVGFEALVGFRVERSSSKE